MNESGFRKASSSSENYLNKNCRWCHLRINISQDWKIPCEPITVCFTCRNRHLTSEIKNKQRFEWSSFFFFMRQVCRIVRLSISGEESVLRSSFCAGLLQETSPPVGTIMGVNSSSLLYPLTHSALVVAISHIS